MQTIQGNRIESLRAVIDFVTEHADRLPDVARSGSYRRLASTVAQLAAFAQDQASSRGAGQGETRLVHSLREKLLFDHLTPIVRMARMERSDIPALAVFRLPHEMLGAAKLASAALEIAAGVEAHAERFVDLGLPSDFVAQLRAAVRGLEEAIDERARCRGRRAGATAGLRSLLGMARQCLLVLDALIRTSAKGDSALLADWESVSHVRCAAARSRVAVAEVLEIVPRAEVRLLSPGIPSISALPERAWATVLSSPDRARAAPVDPVPAGAAGR